MIEVKRVVAWMLELVTWLPWERSGGERVTVAYTSIAGGYAPLWVGEEQNLFDKDGADATLVYMRGTVPTSATSANGQIDFIQAGSSTYIPYAATGGDVVLLACLSTIVLDYVVLVHPSIRRVEDLHGKRIGVSHAADQPFHYLRESLKRSGMGVKDIQFVPTGLRPQRMASLRNGLVVATKRNTPNNLNLGKEGFRRLAEMEKLKIPAGVRCLIATRKTLRLRQTLVENFTKGWLHSLRFIQTRKKETMEIVSKHTINTSQDQLGDARHSLASKTVIPPHVLAAKLQKQIQMIAGDQAKIPKLAAAKIIDNSVIKKRDESGWIKAS